MTFGYSPFTVNFTKLCTIKADVSYLLLEPQLNKYGVPYFQSPIFSVVLALGLTEVVASIAWKENVSLCYDKS